MPNALAKDLELMFEEYVEGYDAACVMSREAETSYPDAQSMQRAGDTFYKKQNYHANVVTGLDISGATPTDVIERFVPTVYRSPDNVLYFLDAKEMRDPEHKRKMGAAASQRLAAEIDKNLMNAVAARAGIFVRKVGAIAWDDAATAEALMLSRGIGLGRERKLFMNPFDHVQITKDLGNRQYMADVNKGAYERSIVPNIAGFKSFRTDNVANSVITGTVASTTVNGNQSHTVSSMTGDVPTDNRQMTLTVQGANVANIKAGDSFTIANVNAVHQVDKTDTGQLMTFRVLATASGGTQLTITPAIILNGPYQNVTTQAAGNAPLTFLNTATRPVNAFWAQGAVCLDYGKLAFPTGEGANVMTATTKNGVPLIMAYQFNSLTARTSVRFTTLYAASVLEPEQCGVIVAGHA
jgi:hypothetical protein